MDLRIAKTTKRSLIGLAISLIIGGCIFFVSLGDGILPGYITQLERLFYDLSFKVSTLESFHVASDSSQIQQSLNLEDRIQIVDIDERSLDRLGAYNLWPRTYHADVLKALDAGGASSIVFDVLFKNADFGSTKTRELLEVVKTIRPNIPWEQDSAAIRHLLNHDSILVHAVHHCKNTIVCALMAPRQIYVHKTQWQPLSEPQWQQRIGTQHTIPAHRVPKGSADAMDLLDNIYPELAQAGKLGLVNVVPDDDGVHRKLPLFHGFPNPEIYPDAPMAYYPIISLQAVLHVLGYNPSELKIEPSKAITIGKPLGIYRDSHGLIRSTYPHLTWPMLRSLLQQRNEIQKMATDSSNARILDLSTRVVARRDSNKQLSVDILFAQTLDSQMISDLLQPSLQWDSLLQAKYKPRTLSPTIQVEWSEEDNLPLIYNTETENEAVINSYTFNTLREYAIELDSIQPGFSRYLSSDLDIQYQWTKSQWRSNFIILSHSVIQDLLNTSVESIEALKPNDPPLRFGNTIQIPVDSKNRMQIHYRGHYAVAPTQRTFKQISYYDILAGRIDPGVYQGKIFILGSTSPALFDLVSAPHESEFPGVLIHATLLDSILNNQFLTILTDQYQFWIILLVALYCALSASFLKPLYSLPLLIVSIAGYYFISFTYFDEGLYIGVARQVLTLVFGFFAMMVLRYIFEEREKKFLNEAFRQYISPDLIDQMVKNEVKPVLGGTKTDLTAFFTDIAGFSTFSEQIGDPSRLVELLNEYLSAMTDILSDNKGTLDKYEGDAIVAFFGAPMPLENHRQSACIAALRMQQKLLELRQKWASEGSKWPPIVHHMHMRIGINSGEIVTGNMGSAMRKNYTMMGDAVNLAARLESSAKQYGAYIQISQATLKGLVPQTIIYRSLDRVKVVGKSEPVDTYELLALQSHATPECLQLVSLWESARQHYLAMEWESAIGLFQKCLPLEPHHPDKDHGSFTTPSHVYLERCQRYQKHPPVPQGQEWDGVYTATQK